MNYDFPIPDSNDFKFKIGFNSKLAYASSKFQISNSKLAGASKIKFNFEFEI